MSYYREQLEDYLKTLDVDAGKILDVGGAQLPVRGRVRTMRCDSITVLDLPRPHKGNAPTLVADINEDYTQLTTWKFDMIFCLEVFEYVWNPAAAMRNLAHWLLPGGTLYASFPFVYPVHEPVKDDALRYTLTGIRKLMEHAGLEVVEVVPRRTLTENELPRFYGHEGMRASRDGAVDHEEVGYIIRATKK